MAFAVFEVSGSSVLKHSQTWTHSSISQSTTQPSWNNETENSHPHENPVSIKPRHYNHSLSFETSKWTQKSQRKTCFVALDLVTHHVKVGLDNLLLVSLEHLGLGNKQIY